MPMQSAPLNVFNTIGYPGDLAYGVPMRSAPYNLDSDGQAQTVGFAYTLVNGGNPNPTAAQGGSPNAGLAKVGGTGIFAGILINPKEYVTSGGSTGALSPTLNLPDNSIGTLMTEGECFVSYTAAGNIGDLVYYDNTSGALTPLAPSASFTGVVATNTLTVSAFVAGGAPLGVGSEIKGTGVNGGTFITALGTGTGGNGTYTVNGAATVSSTAMTAAAIAPTGKTFVPTGRVTRFDISAAGVGVIGINANTGA